MSLNASLQNKSIFVIYSLNKNVPGLTVHDSERIYLFEQDNDLTK